MDIIVGTLAAWGLLMLFWTLAGVVILPLRRREDMTLTVLVRGKDGSPALPRYLKALSWIRNSGLLWWHIAVITDELDADALKRAESAADGEGDISFVTMAQLKDWMEE